MKDKVIYLASGLCWGKCWGGGECGYEARSYERETLEEIEKQINSDIDDGGIDAGMGFEKVLGAVMKIRKITTKIVDGKEFVNTEIEVKDYGKLSDEVLEALENNI